MLAIDATDKSEEAEGLADRLKAHTWPLHREAERSGILNALLRGRADRSGYVLLLRNLAPVYGALDRALERRAADGMLAGIARPELYRSAALQSDLRLLAGVAWESEVALLPGALRYAARIEAAAASAALLIPHAYVRYLGDLNGGQILKRLLGKGLGLPPSHLTFYDFPAIGDPDAFARDLRASVDVAGRRIDAVEPLLTEASIAFQLNIDLSNEVERQAGPAQRGGADT